MRTRKEKKKTEYLLRFIYSTLTETILHASVRKIFRKSEQDKSLDNAAAYNER